MSNDASQIGQWRSIVTLVVFVITNVIVLLPFHIPIYLPRFFTDSIMSAMVLARIIPPSRYRQRNAGFSGTAAQDEVTAKAIAWARFDFPMNFMTAPLIADLFLLAILAIGRKEVHDGTIGANNIAPLDIMAFFITLAYIAISIDASGLIRYLAFKVLQKGGKVGRRLFFYLYVFFFGLGTFIGNDPIILSGTAFLAYMTRVSNNIVHPRAWIHTQFTVANIASAILVSSNPTNLVLAGAFNVSFIKYTANMIVPVVATAVILFPLLLYIIFADESLIPLSITMHELSEEDLKKTPVNPNIPNARGAIDEDEEMLSAIGEGDKEEEERKRLPLEEIMNPFLDKRGAGFGALIMAVTLVTLLVLNAVDQRNGGQPHPVFWVTLPAAVVMFIWDVFFGWMNRHHTREIARRGRMELENARDERARIKADRERAALAEQEHKTQTLDRCHAWTTSPELSNTLGLSVLDDGNVARDVGGAHAASITTEDVVLGPGPHREHSPARAALNPQADDHQVASSGITIAGDEEAVYNRSVEKVEYPPHPQLDYRKHESNREIERASTTEHEKRATSYSSDRKTELENAVSGTPRRDPVVASDVHIHPTTLVSLTAKCYRWLQETFPTMMAVVAHLPFALIPFALSMFVLVQALVTKGWVEVFAFGWDHWVNKTGTVGAVGGMGFLSVVLCNFAGTNIGTTILLSRVIQAWQNIHGQNQPPISDRTFWATVYAMALGVNYGAFSAAFSASLAGLLWRDILARKHIRVRGFDFARVNLPIIAMAMAIGCTVLVGEVYVIRTDAPYDRT